MVTPVKLEKGERLPWLYSNEPALDKPITWLATPVAEPTCKIRPLELALAATKAVNPGLPDKEAQGI